MKRVILILASILTSSCSATGPKWLSISPATNSRSCFQSQETDQTKSVIQLIALRPDGEIDSTGSGFVISGTSDSKGLSKIVTANHLPQSGARRMLVMSSAGDILGRAKFIASATPWNPSEGDNPAIQDIAVMEFEPNTAASAEYWRNIPGLTVADVQRQDSILTGTFNDPAGIDLGASGAPILNHSGQVIGLITKITLRNRQDVPVEFVPIPGSPLWWPFRPHLPQETTAFGDTISSPDILTALGPAGQNVSTSSAQERTTNISVVTAGYPQRLCSVIRGQMSESPIPVNRSRLSQLLDRSAK